MKENVNVGCNPANGREFTRYGGGAAHTGAVLAVIAILGSLGTALENSAYIISSSRGPMSSAVSCTKNKSSQQVPHSAAAVDVKVSFEAGYPLIDVI